MAIPENIQVTLYKLGRLYLFVSECVYMFLYMYVATMKIDSESEKEQGEV